MKRVFSIMLLVSAAMPLSMRASAGDLWGCEVLLCLAASYGVPSECKPPLKKLWKNLLKGKSFPSCTFVSADGRSAGTEVVK